jgi:hypothetical protein
LCFITGCDRKDALDYGFFITNVSVSRVYQALNVRLQQDLQLSQQAREALEHGVTLSIKLELELHNENNMVVVPRDARYFQIRFLPLSERYQLTEEKTGDSQAFSRLRHLLAEIDQLDVRLRTGPLPPGNYEMRVRISLDESRLPTPMQLPVRFSSRWQHDSEWSQWPFEINV